MIQSDGNNPLIVKHCCSIYSISIIKPITLFNALDLVHWTAWADLPSLWKQRNCFPDGGSFIDAFDVEELIWHRLKLTVAWTGVVVVVVSGIPQEPWLCFIGVTKYCVSSSLLLSVSICLVVVRFETGKVWPW